MRAVLAFEQAVDHWKLPPPENDADFDTVCRIERLILGQRPTSRGEAIAMLDLVISEYECGPRSDELDREAVISVRDWLQDEIDRLG